MIYLHVLVLKGDSMGPTGCDPEDSPLVTGCPEEDKEVDEVGEEEDEEPPEMCRAQSSAVGAQRETHLRRLQVLL